MSFLNLISKKQREASAPASGGGGGGAPEPPAGMTGWLKLDDATPGESDAFPVVANAGSVEGNWSRNGSVITLQTVGGPNGMKFANKDGGADNLNLSTLTIGDFITALKGMYGLIFKLTLSGTSSHYFNHSIQRDTNSIIGIGCHAGDSVITPYYRGASQNVILPMAYTTNTWRALVMRWEKESGMNGPLLAKLDGDEEWSEVTLGQDAFSVGGLQVLFDAQNSVTGSIAEWLAYNDQSEEMGDDLLAYLVERAGL